MRKNILIGLFLVISISLILLIAYRNIKYSDKYSEGFRNPPSAYDDSKVYKVGDVVTKDNIIYVMNEGIGAAGYPPPRDPNWKVLPSANLCNPAPYDNGKIYSVGDVVTKDGVKYILSTRIGIGEAGFPPPKPGNWSAMTEESNKQICAGVTPGAAAPAAAAGSSDTNPFPYDDKKVYKVGDIVTKDAIIYVMNEGIGAAGYAPPRDPNWKVIPSANICSPLPYDNGKIYKVGDLVTKDGIKYILSTRIGIGEAGFPPPKPGNWSAITEETNKKICPRGDIAPPSAAAPVAAAPVAAAPAPAAAPAKKAPPTKKAPPAKKARAAKREGFCDVGGIDRSDIVNSLPFGPADLGSSGNVPFTRSMKYDSIKSKYGPFLPRSA